MGWSYLRTEGVELIDTIQSIYPLPLAEANKISDIAQEVFYEKNQRIIEAEKTSKFIYFIKTGLCRIFYPKLDKEVVLDFSFPGDVLISLNSYIHETPGYESIDTIEKSILYRIPSRAITDLYKESIDIANWGRKLAEFETLKIEERLMQQLFKSAQERYQYLLQKEPNLLQKVKLGYIASYLGVSQVTLSRIRGEVR